MEDFKDYCQNYILEKLRNRIGDELYINEESLADTLTSYDMDNGTITMSEPKAMEYINEWQWDAGEFLDYMDFQICSNGKDASELKCSTKTRRCRRCFGCCNLPCSFRCHE